MALREPPADSDGKSGFLRGLQGPAGPLHDPHHALGDSQKLEFPSHHLPSDRNKRFVKKFMPPALVSIDRVQKPNDQGSKAYSRSVLAKQRGFKKAFEARNVQNANSRALLDTSGHGEVNFTKFRTYKRDEVLSHGGLANQSFDASSLKGEQSVQNLTTHGLAIQSPVQQYITQDKRSRFVNQAKDVVSKSPSHQSIVKPLISRNWKDQGYTEGAGALDRARLAQYKMEQREHHLRKNIPAQDLNPDDGDHGRGLLKRKAKVTSGIMGIISPGQNLATEEAQSSVQEAAAATKQRTVQGEGMRAAHSVHNLLTTGSRKQLQPEEALLRLSTDSEDPQGSYPNPPTGYKKLILPTLRERNRHLASEKILIQNLNVNRSLRRYEN